MRETIFVRLKTLNMKKTNRFKTAFCILLTACCIVSFGKAMTIHDDEGTRILIRQIPPVSSNAPRLPIYNPFFAELVNGIVLLGSYSYYGVVDVTLTSTAGDDYSTVFDTADGTIVIPISGSPGEYTLLITTASGLEFIGEFVL